VSCVVLFLLCVCVYDLFLFLHIPFYMSQAGVNFVMICSYVSGGIAAVLAMERLRYTPLAAALTVSLSEASFVQKVRNTTTHTHTHIHIYTHICI